MPSRVSELQKLCGDLRELSGRLNFSVEHIRSIARLLRREAEELRAAVAGAGGSAGLHGQGSVDAMLDAAAACESSADQLLDAAAAGADYARRNALGGGSTAGRDAGIAAASTDGSSASPASAGDGALDGAGGPSDGPATTTGLGAYEPFTSGILLDAASIADSRSQQGQLGDCGLVASCDGLRRFDPTAAAGVVTSNEDGTYTVHLHEDVDSGRPRELDVLVSPAAPRNAAKSVYGTHGPAGGRTVGPSWVTLVEKAMADRKGSYERLEGISPSEVIKAVTGRPCRSTAPPSLEQISELLERGPVIVGSKELLPSALPLGFGPSRRAASSSVVPNHWYSVVTVAEVVGVDGSSSYQIVLENPWGPGDGVRTDYVRLDEATFERSFDEACFT